MKKLLFFLAAIALFTISCKKTNTTEYTGPKLIFKFKFDSTQERLDNLARPSTIPVGNAAQSPVFKSMSAHFIQIAEDSLSPLTTNVLYRNAEVTTGGANAIDFSKSIIKSEGEEFYSVPLKNLSIGTYKWLRISLAYQNYDVKMIYRRNDINGNVPFSFDAEVVSFLGFNTYVKSYTVKGQTVNVNGNLLQGSGAVKAYNVPFVGTLDATTWSAPANQRTTVVNPFAAALGIPPGSCLVTGKFSQSITITGTETKDIIVTVSLSTNKSFEWKDKRADGLYEPVDGNNSNAPLDSVVDMGIRGIKPIVTY
ncbi:MAG: hypothetical protein U0U67_16840 [Chitinophagales bacterium]